MSDPNRTQYAEDALMMERGVQPEEVRQFVLRRVVNPVIIDGLTIYNFNNHVVDETSLREQADELRRNRYVIPYQANGVWGYMVTLFPPALKEIEILAYDQSQGKYHAYPNLIRHSDPVANGSLTRKLYNAIHDRK